MKYYKIKYANGKQEVVHARGYMEVIKKYNLETNEHKDTRIYELSGEQEAIAISNEQN
jgi:hypothetical protein